METGKEVESLNDFKNYSGEDGGDECKTKTREEEIENNLQLQIQQAIEDSIIKDTSVSKNLSSNIHNEIQDFASDIELNLNCNEFPSKNQLNHEKCANKKDVDFTEILIEENQLEGEKFEVDANVDFTGIFTSENQLEDEMFTCNKDMDVNVSESEGTLRFAVNQGSKDCLETENEKVVTNLHIAQSSQLDTTGERIIEDNYKPDTHTPSNVERQINETETQNIDTNILAINDTEDKSIGIFSKVNKIDLRHLDGNQQVEKINKDIELENEENLLNKNLEINKDINQSDNSMELQSEKLTVLYHSPSEEGKIKQNASKEICVSSEVKCDSRNVEELGDTTEKLLNQELYPASNTRMNDRDIVEPDSEINKDGKQSNNNKKLQSQELTVSICENNKETCSISEVKGSSKNIEQLDNTDRELLHQQLLHPIINYIDYPNGNTGIEAETQINKDINHRNNKELTVSVDSVNAIKKLEHENDRSKQISSNSEVKDGSENMEQLKNITEELLHPIINYECTDLTEEMDNDVEIIETEVNKDANQGNNYNELRSQKLAVSLDSMNGIEKSKCKNKEKTYSISRVKSSSKNIERLKNTNKEMLHQQLLNPITNYNEYECKPIVETQVSKTVNKVQKLKIINRKGKTQGRKQSENRESIARNQDYIIREVDRCRYEIVPTNRNSFPETEEDYTDYQDYYNVDDITNNQYISENNSESGMFQDMAENIDGDSSYDFASLPLECIITEKKDKPVLHNIAAHTVPANWLKSYLVVTQDLDRMISKQDVYADYCSFCEQNGIQPFALTMFGKLMKQLFPDLMQRRIRSKGHSMYCYVGLYRRFDYSSLTSYSETPQDNIPNELDMGTHDEKYRSGELDGKTIMVHDPHALLSLPTKEVKRKVINKNASDKVPQNNNPFEKYMKKVNKITTFPLQKQFMRSVSVKSTTQRPIIVKAKFKEYKHLSVKEILSNNSNLALPPSVLSLNVSPVVSLNNNEVYNWYAKRLKNRIKTLLYTDITRSNRGEICTITCRCCTSSTKLNSTHALQLQSMKSHLIDFKVEKSKDKLNYIVKHLPPLEQDKTVPIIKKLKSNYQCNLQVSNKQFQSEEHLSIQKLCNKYKGINLPKRMRNINLSPSVVLNSGEVLQWYQSYIDNLKNKVTNLETDVNDVIDNEKHANLSSQSRTQMINFCETHYSDGESEQMKQQNFGSRESVRLSTINNAQSTESINKNSFEKLIDVLKDLNSTTVGNDREIVNEQPLIQTGQKRPLSNTNEVVLRKKLKYSGDLPLEKPKHTACYMCGFDIPDGKMDYHVKLHLHCDICKRKFPNLEAVMEHLIKHCILNNYRTQPCLKLWKVDSVPEIVQKFPNAFAKQDDAEKEKSILCRTLSTVPNTNSKFSVRNVFVNRRSASSATSMVNPSAVSFINSQGQRCIRTYSKKIPITPTRLITPSKEPKPPIILKNTINSNLNKILVLSNNPSSSKVVYGRVIVSTPGTMTVPNSSITLTSNNSRLNQSQSLVQVVQASKVQKNVVEELQDHSYHQQRSVISTENNFKFPHAIKLERQQDPFIETTNDSFLDKSTDVGHFKIRVKSLKELS